MNIHLIKLIREDRHNLGIPNLLSFSRLLVLPVIVYFITLESRRSDYIAFMLIVLSGMTDFFDGYFARKLKQDSHLGKILDPIVDKINVAVIMLFLAAYKQLPYWYVFFVIGRDVLIMLASIRILSKKQIISTSNIFGKITLTSYLLVILCELLQIKPANKIILWVSAVLIPVSLFKYSVFYRALMGKNRRVFSKDKENLLVNK